jgi:hypothetical protein
MAWPQNIWSMEDPFYTGSAMNLPPTVMGFAEAEQAAILEWLEELDGLCSESREQLLVSKLSGALERPFGIDQEILAYAFLVQYQRKRKFATR